MLPMRFPLLLAFFLWTTPAALAEDPAPAGAAPKAAASEADILEAFNKENPHVRIDAKNGWLEFDAKVCLRQSEMLENLVCTPMTREHESILVSEAKPSRVHLGLLLLGLEAGSPRSVRWVGPNGDEPQIVPAVGPEVEVFLVYKTKETVDGKEVEKEVEMPANRWLVDTKTRKESPNDHWMFTGSRMAKTVDGAPAYVADGEGNLISVVHFGDETLAPHTRKTKENTSDGGALTCNTKLIPELGSRVAVRIKPVKAEKDKKAADGAAKKDAQAPAAVSGEKQGGDAK